jgi:sRNA-binding protein
VFDSSGPEGKVRGTPQQIIDKYNQLARDAQLSNDRVATENFQQHAEHYLRMLGEAQREQEQRREEQERLNRERQADRDRERAERQERQAQARAEDPAEAPQPDVLDLNAPEEQAEDSGLVESPES